ncbi:MAG: hypothetical protein K2J02_03395 [Malacoplasma sp.]|nr:hypothetical protein [Malacoplasma sp.]MDE7075108.1 hypothetical protein [Malacoplasma sp.]
MPYRNEFGAPRFIYRIDSRSPEEIFEEGFQTWGSNTNFFEHILGRSLGDDIPEASRSGIISASDSPDSSLRFFGGMLTDPLESLEYYLYEIRADNNVYSAQRTASFYNQRISSGSIDFEEGDLEIAIDAVDSIMGFFAYQREWFNVGSIPRERVRSAWRVDSVPINPNHIRHQRNVHFTARINEPEILNSNYQDDNTYANELPYTEGATIATTSRVSIPSELVEADASGGVGATLGFACSPTSPSPRDKRSVENRKQMICYFDKGEVHRNLKKPSQKPSIFSDALPFKMYLKGSKSNKEFVLSTDKKEMNSNAMLTELSKVSNAPDFIYDCFQCFTWNPNKEFSLALTPAYSGFQDFYYLNYKIATTNDPLQKWLLQVVKNQTDEVLIRVISQAIRDFSLQRNLKTNEVSLRPIHNHDNNFEELYIVVSENRCDDCVLLPQDSDTKLVDLQLSWFYKNQNYVPIPESGRSKAASPQRNMFFYDLNSYKIIYITKKGIVTALFNNRKNYRWNWVRWIKSNLQKTSDNRLKWYFVNLKWKDTNDLNYRNIMSFDRNDFLRVVISGINWGSLYTTPLKTDIRSLALFRIDPDADI